MQSLSLSSRTARHLFQPARIAVSGTLSLLRLSRLRPSAGTANATPELDDDNSLLWDAHSSMRCGNPARSWRVLSEWLGSRGDQPEDYGWLSARISNWEDAAVMTRLTEARIARLLALQRATEALKLVAERLRANPRFRPASAADTLSWAQLAARSGAPRIARVLLSDFGGRFAGDPRVAVCEALKRRLAQQASA